MRMWMCDTRILCRQHLLGMHLEMHMFIGSMAKKIKMTGYLEKNLLEPLLIKKLHDDLVIEMISRGYSHKSDLTKIDFENAIQYLSKEEINYKVNKEDSLNELLNRCDKCRSIYENM